LRLQHFFDYVRTVYKYMNTDITDGKGVRNPSR